MWLKSFLVFLVFILFILVMSACTPVKPAVVISSPPSGSTYHEGDDVAIQSTSGDQAGVVRVELTIDGAVVRNDTPPSPQTSFTIIQMWKAAQGSHTVTVRAYNAAGAASDPAGISISVGAATAATPVSPSTANTGSITGLVSYTGGVSEPAANVKVALVDLPAISDNTGIHGRYTLSNVPAGAHVVSASTNMGSSNPVNVTVPVGGSATADLVIFTAQPSQTPSPTTTTGPPSVCTNNAAFVADVTVPDGTLWAPGQAFNKIWRVKNTGTCAWTTAYDFAFASGEAMATTTAVAVPNTAPGATADLLVAMAAPATLGVHTGQWKLRNVGDSFFGGAMIVSINVIDTSAPPAQPPAQPPATGCTGSPTVGAFTASPSSFGFTGGDTTLSWDAVSNADSVEIDNGIGGVGTPGSRTAHVNVTTTFTLSAHCGSNTVTAQAKVTVLQLQIQPGLQFQLVLKVTGATASKNVYVCDSHGLATVKFNGTITTNTSGDATYRWEDSNSGGGSTQTLHFSSGTTLSVPQYQVSVYETGQKWIHVLTPTNLTSNKVNYGCPYTP